MGRTEYELILAPIIMKEVIHSWQHDQVVNYVERELANGAKTLIYMDERGLPDFYQVMTFRRALGTLPQRQLFCLKWLRMMEYSGMMRGITGASEHERFLGQMYVGILHADEKASVEFTNTRQGGSWWEENLTSVQAQCLYRFTPDFENVFSETVDMIVSLNEHVPDSAMAEYGMRHLRGSSAGWATSR